MKSNIYSIVAAGLLMTAASACSDDWNPGNESAEGSVQLSSLAIDASDANLAEKEVHSTVSRASIDLSNFQVVIADASGKAEDRTYTYGTMPEVLTLPAGDYRLDVISHTVQPAEWDRPLYKGSKEFSVKAGEITNIGVVSCSFASLKVSIRFADDLLRILGSDSKVTVIVNDNASLDFTPKETRSGFFEVKEGTVTFATHFEGTVAGVKTSSYKAYDDVAVGQHRIITFSVKNNPDISDQSGTIDPSQGIQIDTDVVDQNIAGNINTEEDPIPGEERPWGNEGEDPNTPDDPAAKAASFEVVDSPNLKLGPAVCVPSDAFGNAKVKITCPKGFSHLAVVISTTDPGFEASVGEMLPLSFDLANLSGALATQLGTPAPDGFGFPVNDAVVGKTEVIFDITTFVPLLASFPMDGSTGTHTFSITATDSESKAETAQLIFKVN